MKIINRLENIWNCILKFFRMLKIARISIIMVILSGIIFFKVPQAQDAIIALGNFGSFHHFLITSLAGFAWALMIWYWARVFYDMEYYDRKLDRFEQAIEIHTPRILGGAALVILGFAFLLNGLLLNESKSQGAAPLIILGCLYFVYTIIFLLFIYLRRGLFGLPEKKVHNPAGTGETGNEVNFMPFCDLPKTTKIVLLACTFVSLIVLLLLIISPIRSTIFLGDAITIIILALCIWLPALYWVLYGSKRTGLPLYLVLFIIIGVFSLINSNKDIRTVEEKTGRPETLYEYYNNWYNARLNTEKQREQMPLVMILSEGGGIRAAYWSAGFLAQLYENYGGFSDFTFGVYGISGGTFGATIYTGLVKYFKDHPEKYSKGDIFSFARTIVGKDYLSPVIAGMFTCEVVQAVLPVPVQDFDYAKIFERTWEYHWDNTFAQHDIDLADTDFTFKSPFTSIWENDSQYNISKVFIGTTRVEDGNPYLASNIRLNPPLPGNKIPQIGITKDFFYFTGDKDIRLSTASLISARFPYISPAGICKFNNEFAGFVDGGYFDNTGANTAYNMIFAVKNELEKGMSADEAQNNSPFRKRIVPMVIYIKNGTVLSSKPATDPGMYYQLLAPLSCQSNTRDAHTENALNRLIEFVKTYNGIFSTITLYPDGNADNTEFEIPLGWALSKSVQEEIDKRIEFIMEELKKVDTSNLPPEDDDEVFNDKTEIRELKKILDSISDYSSVNMSGN